MNRTTGTIVAIIILIIIGLVGWYASSMNSGSALGTNATSTATTTVGTEIPVGNSSGKALSSGSAQASNTFHSIFTQSGNNQCTYDLVTSTSQSHNVIDIADGKMHAEFRTTGGTANLMTYSGGILYVWKEGETTGTKANIKSVADLPEAIPHDLTSGAVLGDSDNNVSWDCHAWNKDTSVFAIPSYVTFSWS